MYMQMQIKMYTHAMKNTYKMLNIMVIMYLIGLLYYTRLIFDSIEITVLNVIYYNQFVFMI